MSTLATYTAKVQREVDDNSATRKVIIEQAIQQVYQEILGHTYKYLIGTTEENVTATIGQRYVTPTNTYQKFHKVLWKSDGGNNFYDLTPIFEEDYYDRYVNRDNGDPLCFYAKGDDIYFEVAPSSAGIVKIVGEKIPDELTGSTVSIIPDRYERVVISGAVARFKMFEMLPDAREYDRIYRGSFAGQGVIDGELGQMIQELSVREPVKRIKFFGRR